MFDHFTGRQVSKPYGDRTDIAFTIRFGFELIHRNTRFGDVARRAGARHGLRGAEVDDVLQEVRIRLWRQGSDTDAGGEKLSTLTPAYIYRTATSAALDLLRRRRTRREQLSADVPASLAAPPHARADGMLEAGETLAAIEAAIEAIAPARRPVVRMYLAGYARDEIATLLGWTEDKVRNLLYRGLEDLRQRLVAQGIQP
jgi:RNA polymerase sigma factor (sigma-70 family)